MSGAEFRKNVRKELEDITFIVSGEGALKGTIADISLSGVRFSLDREIPKKLIIEININYKPINFLQKAYIIWSKRLSNTKYEYGAEFINIKQENLILLEDYINTFKS